MDWPFLLVVGGGLSATLAIVGWWQGRLDRAARAKAAAGLREARERGSHRPIGKFPMIQATLCIGCGACARACPEHEVLGIVDGVARIVHGSRCIGLGECEKACPVGAITVGLGDVSARPDLPVLTEAMETTVPGVYVAGELSGVALIRHAIDHGARVIDDVALRLKESPRPRAAGARDVVIVGAGPAGLAASLRAIEKGLDYLTISKDDVGGTIRMYPRRKLTLVQTVPVPLHGTLKAGTYEKEQVLALWEELIRAHGVKVSVGVALQGLRRDGEVLELATSAGPLRARFVVLALGRRGTPRKLGVPGEGLDKVLYALVDAATYRRRRALVVGGGDSAIEAATGLAEQEGNEVTLSYRKEGFFRLKERNRTRIAEYAKDGRVKVVFSSEVERIEPDRVILRAADRPEALSLPNDDVFVFAGGELPFEMLKGMGVRFGGEQKRA